MTTVSKQNEIRAAGTPRQPVLTERVVSRCRSDAGGADQETAVLTSSVILRSTSGVHVTSA